MASAGQHITSATGRPLVYSYGFDEAAATRVAGETNAPDAHDNGNERVNQLKSNNRSNTNAECILS